VAARKDSVIFGLKAFNNWIKSVLIQKMAYEPLSRSSYIKQSPRGSRLSGRVLDIGVGKGGDLQKWQKARIREYVALDVADVSVEQAKGRWKKMSTDKFDAIFAALDCYTVSQPPFHSLGDWIHVLTRFAVPDLS
jgi:mRNA (guanine-N7-)-methyltransferase